MKKSQLRPVNKKALKTAALLAATAALGYHTYTRYQAKANQAKAISEFQNNLVEYKDNQTGDQIKVNQQTGTETLTISEKVPEIAIFYHTDGRISILYHRTVYSLATLMQEEPALAANIQAYITATHDQVIDTMEQ